jgi:hypothetical protein
MKKLRKTRRKTYKSPFGVENSGVPILPKGGHLVQFTEEERRFLRSLGSTEVVATEGVSQTDHKE